MRSKLLLATAAAASLIAAVGPASANSIGSDRAGRGRDLGLRDRSDHSRVSFFDGRGGAGDWNDDHDDDDHDSNGGHDWNGGHDGNGGDGHGDWGGGDWDHGDWGHGWTWHGGHPGRPDDDWWEGKWRHHRDCKPIPEPATAMLIALGLGGLVAGRRR